MEADIVDILVRPAELRQVSQTLRGQAQKIAQAIEAVDAILRALKGQKFLGNRANALQVRYEARREALLATKNLILRFAAELERAASTFEQADKGSGGGGGQPGGGSSSSGGNSSGGGQSGGSVPYKDVYDGKTPAPGTTNTRQWIPIDAPLKSDLSNRSPERYNDILDQFAVANNPRYTVQPGKTWCNIFVWDATKAMGAEVPHWVDSNGNTAAVGAKGAKELGANGIAQWFQNHGERHGWRAVSVEEAQRMANEGRPVVASWRNPDASKPGHVAMVRPGEGGLTVAQAGATNSNSMAINKAFGTGWSKGQVVLYVHD